MIEPQKALEALDAFEQKHGTELVETRKGCICWGRRDRPNWSYQSVRLPLYRWAACAVHQRVLMFGTDQVIRHQCDNPRCFNPDHLEFGTRAENNNDRAWIK